ncbi:MAG TPA: hypothetical protein PLM07_20735 [Candidatus Rifleibacterium sp.]|nr:hypothetical protein [Candidatus Rifleibacterium sp.]
MNLSAKNVLLMAATMLLASVQAVHACAGGCSGVGCSPASVTFDLPESSISADTLAGLLRSGSPLTLIECRNENQKRDLKIPGAKIWRQGTPIASISESLPATDSLIILYPGLDGGKTASVAVELQNLGYLSILEYQPGVYGWMTFGFEPEGTASSTY